MGPAVIHRAAASEKIVKRLTDNECIGLACDAAIGREGRPMAGRACIRCIDKDDNNNSMATCGLLQTTDFRVADALLEGASRRVSSRR